MEHFKAPILFASPGVRYTQCCKCGKIMSLGSFHQAGDHLLCLQCPANLLLTEMTMVEWDEYQQLHPCNQPSPAMRVIIAHAPRDYALGCECPSCNRFREQAKELGCTPFELAQELSKYPADFFQEKNSTITESFKTIKPISFVSGSFKIDSGEVIEPLHKRQGFIKDGNLTSERCSKEADAAQKLFLYFGASVKTLIKNAERGCSFERAQIQQGRFLLIPSDKSVSLSSPLAIQMLMHFHATPSPFLDGHVSTWPPAQRGIVSGFLNNGVIVEGSRSNCFDTTEKGCALVTALGAVLKEGIKNV